MRKLFWILLLGSLSVSAATYQGRVVDTNNQPLMYATVYVQTAPEVGTATNMEGWFSLSTDSVSPDATLMISSMGYQTRSFPLHTFASSGYVVQLDEQPILLTPSLVEAKKTHQSKRKKMATLLHAVYEQLQAQSPKSPAQYRVVSDVKMDARQSAWGMEQMVATVVEIPSTDITKSDSVQFMAQSCKRYCDPTVRKRVDQLYVEEQDKTRKRMAAAIDSGTVVHRVIWEMSQMDKSVLLDLSDELSRWKMTKPDNQHLMLTYTRKRSFFLGVVQLTEVHHLLVDNEASLQTYVCDEHVKVFLPFSIKIKDSDLSWVNLLNMDAAELQKFRLKKANMHVRFETQYAYMDGVRVPQQKTTHVEAMLEDNKKNQLPCEFRANQQILSIRLSGVSPFPYYSRGQRVHRQLVPIY